MDDLEKYIKQRKAKSKTFAKDFEEGYDNFRIGYLLKQARKKRTVTQNKFGVAVVCQPIVSEYPNYCRSPLLMGYRNAMDIHFTQQKQITVSVPFIILKKPGRIAR